MQRRDFSSTGWTATPDGGAWTMQEPYGAFTWYAVNDQPSDKALYDITLRVPPPMVGVANGELLSQRVVDGLSVSRWRLDEPAASYLVTGGDRRLRGDPGPLVVGGADQLLGAGRAAPTSSGGSTGHRPALDWLEERLGPFPYDRLGFLIVPGLSGMETQTMITLGDNLYATVARGARPRDGAPLVRRHRHARRLARRLDERGHGDVPPGRLDERARRPVDGCALRRVGRRATPSCGRRRVRRRTTTRTHFGSSNVYYIPAVMWNELREDLGDEEFWRLVREWPSVHENGNADYDDITDVVVGADRGGPRRVLRGLAALGRRSHIC